MTTTTDIPVSDERYQARAALLTVAPTRPKWSRAEIDRAQAAWRFGPELARHRPPRRVRACIEARIERDRAALVAIPPDPFRGRRWATPSVFHEYAPAAPGETPVLLTSGPRRAPRREPHPDLDFGRRLTPGVSGRAVQRLLAMARREQARPARGLRLRYAPSARESLLRPTPTPHQLVAELCRDYGAPGAPDPMGALRAVVEAYRALLAGRETRPAVATLEAKRLTPAGWYFRPGTDFQNF